MTEYRPHCSSMSSVSANLIAIAAIVIGPFFGVVGLVVAIIILILEKNSGLVKYYASLGIVLWLVRAALSALTSIAQGFYAVGENFFGSIFTVFHWSGNLVVSLLRFFIMAAVVACAAYGAYKAYKWTVWKPPVLGTLAEEICKRVEAPLYSGGEDVPEQCRQKNARVDGGEASDMPGAPDTAGNSAEANVSRGEAPDTGEKSDGVEKVDVSVDNDSAGGVGGSDGLDSGDETNK